ncbi:MAG: universal stress protein [Bacteroidetes bacterium]|nr:universal stress protein [Bacteroidota bacterium]
MASFKRLMVGLDFSAVDNTVLEYTKMISETLKPEIIYFIHSEQDLDLDEELAEEAGINTKGPADEELAKKLEIEVAQYFESNSKTEIVCQIVEGSPFQEMLHWSHIKKVDLLIVGKKKLVNGKGVLPNKLARKIDASVLFVPEGFNVKSIENIFLPSDFSKHSKIAYNTCKESFSNTKLTCGNCFSLPLGWYKTGKTEEEFTSIMKRNAEKKFEKFKESINDNSLECVFSIDPNNEPSVEILEMADRINADLIAIGARGKTDAATVILGSTTEKTLAIDVEYPLLVIKDKGENISFLQALFNLK